MEVRPEGLEQPWVFEVGAELGEPRGQPPGHPGNTDAHRVCWGASVLNTVGRIPSVLRGVPHHRSIPPVFSGSFWLKALVRALVFREVVAR